MRLVAATLVITIALLTVTCAARRPSGVGTTPPPRGTLTDQYVPTYVVSRFGLASGCPVAPRRILTARHAVAYRGLASYEIVDRVTWGQPSPGTGISGFARVLSVDTTRDLAVLEPEAEVPVWYELASEAPVVGERVVVAGYDFQRHLRPLVLETEVVQVLPGHVVLGTAGTPGFSGSCVYGARGALAVLHWALTPQDWRPNQKLGIGSAIWGPWRP